MAGLGKVLVLNPVGLLDNTCNAGASGLPHFRFCGQVVVDEIWAYPQAAAALPSIGQILSGALGMSPEVYSLVDQS